ncbi:unnamed protein product, partial [Phaeothamnion confervicola]
MPRRRQSAASAALPPLLWLAGLQSVDPFCLLPVALKTWISSRPHIVFKPNQRPPATCQQCSMVRPLLSATMTADVASEDAPGGPPLPTNRELVRLELKEVPAEAARKWLRDWGGRRVPDRPDVDAPGVPRTNMPVTAEVKDGGAGIRLSFDASPTDTVELDVYPLARGASCVVASVGDDGAARQGMLGPQIEALVRQAQERIELKLQRDTNAFARDYHHSAVAA